MKNHAINLPRVVTLVFLVIALLLVLNHELWRDELQPWLIAKASSSIPDLAHNMRYEGHALIWPAALFLLTRFSGHTFGIQALHLLIAVAAVFLLLRFSPFTRLQKSLLAFGYFTIFEYCVVCRPYVVALLLVYCFCALSRRSRGSSLLGISVVLFLLCQTSVYGVLLAFALSFMLLFRFFYDRQWRTALYGRKWILAATIVIIVAGFIVSVVLIRPPEDSGFAPYWHFGASAERLAAVAKLPWRTFAPVPQITYEFWETNIVTVPAIQYALSAVLVGFFALLFIRKPVILALYTSGTLAILAFTYVKYIGRLRHHGHLFMLLVACLWLAGYYPARSLRPGFGKRLADFAEAHAGKVVMFILIAQLAGALIAGGIDLIYPFSANKEVVEYLRDNGLDEMLIVGDKDYAAMGVSGHLGREIYYPRAGRMGTYVIYSEERRYMRPARVFGEARRLAGEREEAVLVLLNYDPGNIETRAVKIAEFTRSVVETERFYLYRVECRENGIPQ